MHYKFIDLPNLDLIAQRILKHVPEDYKKKNIYKSLPIEIFTACTPLVEAVETIKPWSDLEYIAMIVALPDIEMPIHTDLGSTLVENKYALNIPIYNCEKPYTAFFRVKDHISGVERTHAAIETPSSNYLHYNETDVVEIGRMHLYKAAFFNTQVPHTVINTTDDLRIIISIRSKTPFI
jgi:hypothetical protein